jgi:hypothetical protein
MSFCRGFGQWREVRGRIWRNDTTLTLFTKVTASQHKERDMTNETNTANRDINKPRISCQSPKTNLIATARLDFDLSHCPKLKSNHSGRQPAPSPWTYRICATRSCIPPSRNKRIPIRWSSRGKRKWSFIATSVDDAR